MREGHLFEFVSINLTSKNSLPEQHHRLFNRPEWGACVDLRLICRRLSAAFHPQLSPTTYYYSFDCKDVNN